MIESKYKIERTGEISMCWNNNKQSIIASIMIFSSLMIFTILTSQLMQVQHLQLPVFYKYQEYY